MAPEVARELVEEEVEMPRRLNGTPTTTALEVRNLGRCVIVLMVPYLSLNPELSWVLAIFLSNFLSIFLRLSITFYRSV